MHRLHPEAAPHPEVLRSEVLRPEVPHPAAALHPEVLRPEVPIPQTMTRNRKPRKELRWIIRILR